jgi:hypothetical protein
MHEKIIKKVVQNEYPPTDRKNEKKESIKKTLISDSNLLEKIALIEAIDPSDNRFNESRYNDYKNSERQRGDYSVTENQKRTKEAMEIEEKIVYSDFTEPIYGAGGFNRYVIEAMTGEVTLKRGGDVTTGSPEYLETVKKKAKELGLWNPDSDKL